MKIRLISHANALLLVAVWLLAGCVSDHNWNQRVGQYSYHQAVEELGQPATLIESRVGTKTAEWITKKGTPNTVGHDELASAIVIPGPNEKPVVPVAEARLNEYLRLTFGSDGQLTEWKRFYR